MLSDTATRLDGETIAFVKVSKKILVDDSIWWGSMRHVMGRATAIARLAVENSCNPEPKPPSSGLPSRGMLCRLMRGQRCEPTVHVVQAEARC